MEYRELPLPPCLEGLVAAVWTMRHQGSGDEWIEHDATPDGCVEAILRLTGRSAWRRDQPACFVTGLGTQSIRFGFSGDAEFLAVKLWPWAWEALGGVPCPSFADDWRALDDSHPLSQLLANGPEAMAQTKAWILKSACADLDADEFTGLVESHAKKRQSAEASEGLASFAEKRAGRWGKG